MVERGRPVLAGRGQAGGEAGFGDGEGDGRGGAAGLAPLQEGRLGQVPLRDKTRLDELGRSYRYVKLTEVGAPPTWCSGVCVAAPEGGGGA